MENNVNKFVESILEVYHPKLGMKYGLSYPMKGSKDGYIWELELLYEKDEDELKELMRNLEQDEKEN